MTLLDGTPIKDDEYYSLATNDFMVTGGDGYDFTGAEDIYNTNICMRDSIMDYWKLNGVPAGETKLLIAGEAPVVDDNDGSQNGGTTTPDNNGSQGGNGTKPGTNDSEADKDNGAVKPGDKPSKDEGTKTGDNTQIEVLALLALAAIAGVGYTTVRRKKEA